MTTHLSADLHSETPPSSGGVTSAEPITVTILDARTDSFVKTIMFIDS